MATAKKKQEQAEDMESDLEDLDGQDSYEDGQLDQNGVNMCWKLSPTLKLNSAKQKQNALLRIRLRFHSRQLVYWSRLLWRKNNCDHLMT